MTDNLNQYHKSVLTKQIIEYLAPENGKTYVDATFGGGGHSTAIMKAAPDCKLIAIDWDHFAIDTNGPDLKDVYGDKIEFVWGNFLHLVFLLKKLNIKNIDGIIADFGTSQYQIFNKPGFSFSVDTPLDMRMSPGQTQITAGDIVNEAHYDELVKIFLDYGQEWNARKIARAICLDREKKPFKTTSDLAELIKRIYKGPRTGIHPATKVFQALRIVVNDELNNIKSLLIQSLQLLNPNGRMVFISFHSLEDRIVKQFFKEHTDALDILTKKVITADPDELEINPSSRSAKLRAALKKN